MQVAACWSELMVLSGLCRRHS